MCTDGSPACNACVPVCDLWPWAYSSLPYASTTLRRSSFLPSVCMWVLEKNVLADSIDLHSVVFVHWMHREWWPIDVLSVLIVKSSLARCTRTMTFRCFFASNRGSPHVCPPTSIMCMRYVWHTHSHRRLICNTADFVGVRDDVSRCNSLEPRCSMPISLTCHVVGHINTISHYLDHMGNTFSFRSRPCPVKAVEWRFDDLSCFPRRSLFLHAFLHDTHHWYM